MKMNQKGTIISIILILTLLSGCSNQNNETSSLRNDIESTNIIINVLEKATQRNNSEITNLKEKINELEKKIEENNKLATEDKPLIFKPRNMYYEGGKVYVTLDFPEARTYGVNGAKINDYYSFDVIVVNENQEVQMYLPEIKSIGGTGDHSYQLIFPEVVFKKMIIRIYELSTGRIAEAYWEDASDI